jgi:hypothetical protein
VKIRNAVNIDIGTIRTARLNVTEIAWRDFDNPRTISDSKRFELPKDVLALDCRLTLLGVPTYYADGRLSATYRR